MRTTARTPTRRPIAANAAGATCAPNEAAGVVLARQAAGLRRAPNERRLHQKKCPAKPGNFLVEAAGVEPASENTSSKTSYVRVSIPNVAAG
jgi:hypothetical protein